MNCPKCGTPNHPQSQYCAHCRYPLVAAAQPAGVPISAQISALHPRDRYAFFGGLAAAIAGIVLMIQGDFSGQVIVLASAAWAGPGGLLMWAPLSRTRPASTRMALQLAAAGWGAGITTYQAISISMWSGLSLSGYSSDSSLIVFAGAAGFWFAFFNIYQKATRGA